MLRKAGGSQAFRRLACTVVAVLVMGITLFNIDASSNAADPAQQTRHAIEQLKAAGEDAEKIWNTFYRYNFCFLCSARVIIRACSMPLLTSIINL